MNDRGTGLKTHSVYRAVNLHWREMGAYFRCVSQAPDLSKQLGYKNIRRATSRGRTGVENNFIPRRFSRSDNRPFFLLVCRAKMQYGETYQVDVEQEKLQGRFTVPHFTHRAEITSASKGNKFSWEISCLSHSCKKILKYHISSLAAHVALDICR